jgi:hypothetical protein
MGNKKVATKRQPSRTRSTGRRKAALNHSFITSTPVQHQKHPRPRPLIRDFAPVSDVEETRGEVSVEDIAAEISKSFLPAYDDSVHSGSELEESDIMCSTLFFFIVFTRF